ncbi:hypothetical protein FVE85_2835 [Porphyridium purpureum]|uniref:Single-stranded DNA-binding protein n=1 Tax=Porphyridium purpureum TaxID=35688 RepID=A0A5J4YV77_PORPP|nr:hypothetical protein FVE85_2835 [Porphyridium purpureum]|eukprot:POR9062..scf227_4
MCAALFVSPALGAPAAGAKRLRDSRSAVPCVISVKSNRTSIRCMCSSTSSGSTDASATFRANHVELRGVIEKEPGVRAVGESEALRLASFVLLVPRYTADRKKAFDKVEIKAWNELADLVSSAALGAGEEVALQGKLRHESYTTKSGTFVSKLTVVADELHFRDALAAGRGEAQPRTSQPQFSAAPKAEFNGSATMEFPSRNAFAGLSPRSPAKQVIEQISDAVPWNDPDWWPASQEEFEMAIGVSSSTSRERNGYSKLESSGRLNRESVRVSLPPSATESEPSPPSSGNWLTELEMLESKSYDEIDVGAADQHIIEDPDLDTYIPSKVSDGSFAGLGLLDGETNVAAAEEIKEEAETDGDDEWSDGESDTETLTSVERSRQEGGRAGHDSDVDESYLHGTSSDDDW